MIRTNNTVVNISDVPDTWIFEYYCNLSNPLSGQSVRIKSIFNSSDNTPSMFIYVNKTTGKYCFKDFSTGIGGSAFHLVQNIKNIRGYADTCNLIIKEYSQFLTDNINYKPVNPENIRTYRIESFDTRLWNTDDVKYWTSYNIGSNLLEKYNVKPLASITLAKHNIETGKLDFIVMNKIYTYGFFGPDGFLYKIYNPFNKEYKFLNIHKEEKDGTVFCQGKPYFDFDKINDKNSFIVSSLKDGMALESLNLNSQFLAPSSENNVLDVLSVFNNDMEMVKNWQKNALRPVYILFDNDDAGQIGAISLQEKFKYYTPLFSNYTPSFLEGSGKPVILSKILNLNLEKDIADSIKKHGVKKVREEILKLMQ